MLDLSNAVALLTQAGWRAPDGVQAGAWPWVQALVDGLCDLSSRDPLTGLANRRQFETALAREIDRVARVGEPSLLIVADIDHFKAINDHFGHDVGDAVIVALATLMQRDLRADAALCRSGGEEFLLLLPGVSLVQAQRIAERLRMTVANHEMEQAGCITISLGVAHWPGDASDLGAVLKQADKELYQAKHRGRNCVVVAGA